ncbi:uncharacterized protein G2W53_003252 [Senna tora]|uniref:Uncharacterized protein n=1 Tax=Senna tora TaxID=362788 RepID=A0A834X9T6_9FABA|nr:uncharacterized protein G2W53_003252 [Senna tora]
MPARAHYAPRVAVDFDDFFALSHHLTSTNNK